MRHRPTHPVGKFVGKVTLLVLIDALHVELPTFSGRKINMFQLMKKTG